MKWFSSDAIEVKKVQGVSGPGMELMALTFDVVIRKLSRGGNQSTPKRQHRVGTLMHVALESHGWFGLIVYSLCTMYVVCHKSQNYGCFSVPFLGYDRWLKSMNCS